MENFEETLVHGSEEELQELKSWLFRENIRLATAAKELEHMQEQFLKEKIQFQEEMKLLNQKMSSERQRLKEDNQFFEKKWKSCRADSVSWISTDADWTRSGRGLPLKKNCWEREVFMTADWMFRFSSMVSEIRCL